MLFAVSPKVSTRSNAWPGSSSGTSDSAIRHWRRSARLTKKSVIGARMLSRPGAFGAIWILAPAAGAARARGGVLSRVTGGTSLQRRPAAVALAFGTLEGAAAPQSEQPLGEQ